MIKAPLAVLGAAIAAASLALARVGAANAATPSATLPKASEAAGRYQNAQLAPGSKERIREFNELGHQASKAEARGDLAEAERLYRQLITLNGFDMPGLHVALARLFDKQGREREAFVEYRVVVYGRKNTWSSNQEDPRVLTRYGDLCEKYDLLEEAARAYAYAAQKSRREEAYEPNSVPRNESYPALNAAAHTAAAIELGSHGDYDGRTRELEIAVRTDPDYWVPRFYRARDFQGRGRLREAGREIELADRLAPRDKKVFVREARRRERIPDAQGRLIDETASGLKKG